MEITSLWKLRQVRRPPDSPQRSQESWRHRLQHLNSFSTLYFATVLAVCGVVNVCVALPHRFGLGSWAWLLRSVFTVFLIVEVLANFLAVRSTARRNFTTSAQLPRWTGAECAACGRWKPRRSHHCLACGRCVLRRDHHCFFTASCIGHWNQRHFLCFLLYVGLGSGYSLANMADYLTTRHVYPSVVGLGLLHYLLPVCLLQCVLGYASLANLLLVLCFDITLGAALFAGIYGLVQVFVVIRGQVSHEFFSGASGRPRALRDNLYEVFGEYGFLQLLFPLPGLALPSDGTD